MAELVDIAELAAIAAVMACLYASSTLTVFLALLLFSRPGAAARRAVLSGRRPELSGMAWLSLLWLPALVAFGFGSLEAGRRCRGG